MDSCKVFFPNSLNRMAQQSWTHRAALVKLDSAAKSSNGLVLIDDVDDLVHSGASESVRLTVLTLSSKSSVEAMAKLSSS